MTRFAVGDQVHAHQLHILMEVPATHGFPAIFRMTARALRTVGAFMRIRVTGRAILRFQIREFIFAFRSFVTTLEFFIRRGMALGTTDFLMFAFEFEIRPIVIEAFSRRKRGGRVTARAWLRGELRIEHGLMFVHVTVLAIASLPAGEDEAFPVLRRLRRQDDILRRLVALNTILGELLVSAGDLKVGLIVIELIQLIEAIRRVAAGTGFLKVFFLQLFLMNGRVTVRAEIRILIPTELKVVSRLGNLDERNILSRGNVTAPAAFHVFMLARELKAGRIVIEGRARIELHGRVAGRAGFLLSGRSKLVSVRRGMAIHAELLLEAREFIDLFALHVMTAFTAEFLVRTGKRETRFIMEGRVAEDLALRVLDVPPFRRVTGLTRHAFETLMERSRVRRLVAALTGFLGNPFEEVGSQGIRHFLQTHSALRLMTVEAGILQMFADQGKTRLGSMIES